MSKKKREATTYWAMCANAMGGGVDAVMTMRTGNMIEP